MHTIWHTSMLFHAVSSQYVSIDERVTVNIGFQTTDE